MEVLELKKHQYAKIDTLQTIDIPDSVVKIGSHCFYDCRNLMSVTMGDGVRDIEDGAFKNCDSLREIRIKLEEDNMELPCIKEVLSQCNKELFFYLLQQGNVVAKFVFPKYQLDYEANVEARIINQLTYGSGVLYRECVSRKGIKIPEYDRIFDKARHEDREETMLLVAVARLAYPVELVDARRQIYEAYVQEYFEELVEYLVKNHDVEVLKEVCKAKILNKAQMRILRERTQRENLLNMTVVLMDADKNLGEKSEKRRKFALD